MLNAAARFLEARQRSIDEVRRHLTAAAYPADLIERAIERLTELRMLAVSAAILLLTVAVLIIRYGHTRFPYRDGEESAAVVRRPETKRAADD